MFKDQGPPGAEGESLVEVEVEVEIEVEVEVEVEVATKTMAFESAMYDV